MRMRLSIIAILLFSSAVAAIAGRNNLKPSDFEPLTSLPWEKPNATTEMVLDAIFREPNINIRYPLLADYLRIVPIEDLGKAFDLCIGLEGAQTPNQLVAFFLPIWAKRDPKACWKQTRELFRLVGFEDGWLIYDGWKKRPRITVQDLNAIQKSSFWLEQSALMSFPLGIEESSLPKKERVRIMKEFADRWFVAFGTWPGRGYSPRGASTWYPDRTNRWINIFERPQDQLRGLTKSSVSDDETAFELALRRWLQAEPVAAPEIIKTAQETKWPPLAGQTQERSVGPSLELFMIWAKADLPAMVRWAEPLDIRKDEFARTAKGFLMSRVDAETSERWLADAKSTNPEEDFTSPLLADWAKWDAKPAFAAAVATKNAETIVEVADAAVSGPWGPGPWNTWCLGAGAIKDFDIAKLSEDLRNGIRGDWAQCVMEAWGEIDVGAAARHGFEFMLATDYAPRDRLTRFFSGHDEYPDEGGMIDRTFCALRVWAVVRPKEMKAWIGTLEDAEMRKALTWLLEHPWGTGPEE